MTQPISLPDYTTYPASVLTLAGTTYALARNDQGRRLLLVQGDGTGFTGDMQGDLLCCPLSAENAAALRGRLPWLRPVALGLATSAGFGDRLGLATPGHVAAVRETGIAPIFAQQSVRENVRTGRTPQGVLDDAMWGVFQSGLRGAWGADADHLKAPADIAPFVAAGYTFYTIDPGDHVNDAANRADAATLAVMVDDLPWDVLESSPAELVQALADRDIRLESMVLSFDRESVLRAAAKYGRAVAHTVQMAALIARQMGDTPFDLEMSVDETETVTSIHEHFYVMHELRRLGVPVVSLAPRFVGRFEKGVDYIGDLEIFEEELARHTAIMHHFGGYKLSLHSGSDKFSIYAPVHRHARGLVHLKTAGTSYLEALRVVAQEEPAFFRAILELAHARFAVDRATYHISAELAKVPAAAHLRDDQLPALLDQFDARQVLHVTFGSVLDQYGDRLHVSLLRHEAQYAAALERHFARHLAPLADGG